MNLHRSLALGAIVASLGATAAHADLLTLPLGFPLTTYDNQGLTTYDPGTQLLRLQARPLAVRFNAGSPPRVVMPTGDPATTSVTVGARVDSSGQLVEGVPGDDLVVVGQVDQNGDGTPDFVGVLLTGEVTQLGFENAPSPSTTDFFNFRFNVTGGALAPLYGLNDIGLTVTSEMSSFDGDWTVVFAGEAKGNIAPTGPRTGFCCAGDGSCTQVTEEQCAASGGRYGGDGSECCTSPSNLHEPGRHRLTNREDSPGGAVVFNFRGLNEDVLFDFEAPGTGMFLEYDGTGGIRIFGRSRATSGGVTGFADFDFNYVDATEDFDEGQPTLTVFSTGGVNSGTIRWLPGGEVLNYIEALNPGGYSLEVAVKPEDGTLYIVVGWFSSENGVMSTGDMNSALEPYCSCPPPPPPAGACCLESGLCVVATAAQCAAQGGSYQGNGSRCTPTALGGVGTYRLGNHPDGAAAGPFYGLRLDELFNVTPGSPDIFTFDFEAPGTAVYLDYDGTRICIYGRAFGGRDIGDAYDPAWTGFVDLNFCYAVVGVASGDDDLIVTTPNGSNSGTVTWVNTGEIIPIYDYAGDFGFTFRFGDEDNDQGHRGFDGLSGWGWLNHRDPGVHVPASDWIFTARPLCIPPVIRVGACCEPDGSCSVLTEAACVASGGTYQGDGIRCTPTQLGEAGSYRLANHPDGTAAEPFYGMRLDELFDVTPSSPDIFSFDFEAPGTAVFMDYDGATIRIHGRAFGGRDAGDSYDPAWKSFIDIDFTYTVVHAADGDDDLIVVTPSGTNSGTVTWVNTGEIIPIYDYAGDFGFTFRFGNEDDDQGHRGFDGLSGWGWLNHRDPDVHQPASDWFFTARPVCRPAPHLAVLHYDFDEQTGSWVYDRAGEVDLQFKRGNGTISWVNDSVGTGVRISQSTSSGTARLQTTSTSIASGLKSALQATNAITVQVHFQQDGGHSSGARIFSYSSSTSTSDRNVSVIGDPRWSESDDDDDDRVLEGFDNWTRLRTNSGTYSDGPDDCWDPGRPVVYAFTYDANTSDLLRIYINGRLVHTDATTKGTFSNWTNRHVLLGNEKTQDRPFKGNIYDVKVWNAALDGTEIWEQAQALIAP